MYLGSVTYSALLVNLSLGSIIKDVAEGQHGVVKSRHKRYVAFPEGSTFIATLCLTLNILERTENIFLEGINWGISYDLPNASTVREVFGSNKFAHKRRQRRDLYNRVETVLERLGFGGRSCIYRAICESPRKLSSRNTYLAQDILRQFFTYPLKRLSYLEPDDHRKYHWAARYSSENTHLDCGELFPDCTISIIDLALGT